MNSDHNWKKTNMLPHSWHPRTASKLTRIGNQNDGGYVIPQNVLGETELLIGLGLNDDWSFEEDFRNQSKCDVICYDHTVTRQFWVDRFVLDICTAIRLRKTTRLQTKDTLKYLQYKKFFRQQGVTHHALMVGPESMGGTPLSKILTDSENKKTFLKIDIEGWEYRILSDLASLPVNVLGFVIEFHDIDLHRSLISDFISSLSAYQIAHIHGNNFGSVDENGDPVVVEMTFLRNEFCPPVENTGKSDQTYPVSGLDFPNHPYLPDIQLNFESP